MNAEQMTTHILFVLAILGGWNFVNMLGRICYREPWWPYAWSVALGAYAVVILWMR
jgi:hypothetical protein